jgi:uncharacterized protein (TIGR04255 family)
MVEAQNGHSFRTFNFFFALPEALCYSHGHRCGNGKNLDLSKGRASLVASNRLYCYTGNRAVNYQEVVIRSMPRVYENPPIREAVCEFRFEPTHTWDATVLGLVYDKLKGEFPKKRQPAGIQVEVRTGPQSTVESIGTPSRRMQFLREDERALVQVAPDFLSVNHFKPYSKWENFKQLIIKALEAYRQVNDPRGVRRLGLRYINQINIPEEQVEIEDYLRAVPKIPNPIPQTFAAWVQRVEVPFEEECGLLVIQSGSVRDQGEHGVAFMLDLDFIFQVADPVPLDSTVERIEKAHARVESAFEACITEKARQLFKEVKTR